MTDIKTRKVRIAESMTELWNPLTEEQREYLVANIQIKEYGQNQIIYSEDDTPEFIMCLIQGKVKVYKNGTAGRQQIVRVIRPMGLFGYRAGFADEKYMTGAASLETSVLCLIPTEVIKHLIKNNNNLAIFFIRQLCTKLGDADLLTVNLTQKHLRARLADTIIAMKDKFGVEEDGCTLRLAVSREDLSNMACMTASNAARTLSSFASDNLVEVEGRKIRIIDEEKLKHISEMG